MYIDRLKLPNEDEPTMLEAVNACNDPDVFERAQDVCNIVRAGITPMRARAGTIEISPDAISRAQQSNCYGSNIVLSEALEIAKVPHYVAFANDHVFTIAVNNGSLAHLIDAHSPDFNGNITGAFTQTQLMSVPAQIEENRRAIAKMDSSFVVQNSRFNRSFEELVTVNPWLSHGSEMERLEKRPINERKEYFNHILTVALYNPTLGRQIIERRNRLYLFLEGGKYEAAASELHFMKGIYPEVDPRNIQKAKQLGSLVLHLAKKGDNTLAQQVIADVSESYEGIPNINLALWPADQLRKIGVQQKDTEFLSKAIAEYNDILDEYPRNRLALGKLAAAKSVLAKIS